MLKGSIWENRPLELYNRQNEGYSFDLTLDLKDPLKSELKPPSSQSDMTDLDAENKENSSSGANHNPFVNFSLKEKNSNENNGSYDDVRMQDDTSSSSPELSPACSLYSTISDTELDLDNLASKSDDISYHHVKDKNKDKPVESRRKLPAIKIKIKKPSRKSEGTSSRSKTPNSDLELTINSKENDPTADTIDNNCHPKTSINLESSDTSSKKPMQEVAQNSCKEKHIEQQPKTSEIDTDKGVLEPNITIPKNVGDMFEVITDPNEWITDEYKGKINRRPTSKCRICSMKIKITDRLLHLTEKHLSAYEKCQSPINHDHTNSTHPEADIEKSEAPKAIYNSQKSSSDIVENVSEMLQLPDISKTNGQSSELNPSVGIHSQDNSNSDKMFQVGKDTSKQNSSSNAPQKLDRYNFFETLFEKINDKSKWITDTNGKTPQLRPTATCLTCSDIIRGDHWVRHLKAKHSDIYIEYRQLQREFQKESPSENKAKETGHEIPPTSPGNVKRNTILDSCFQIISDKSQWIKEKQKKGKAKSRPTAKCLKCSATFRKDKMVNHLKVHHRDIYDEFLQVDTKNETYSTTTTEDINSVENPQDSSLDANGSISSQVIKSFQNQESNSGSTNIDTLLQEMYPNVESVQKIESSNLRNDKKYLDKWFTKISDRTKWLSYGDRYRGGKCRKYPTSSCNICSNKVKSSKILPHLKVKHPNEHEEYLSYVEAEKIENGNDQSNQTDTDTNTQIESCLDESMRYVDTIFEILDKTEWVPYEHAGEKKLTPAYKCNLCKRTCRQDLRVLHLEKNHNDAFDQYLLQSRMVDEEDLSRPVETNSTSLPTQQQANKSRKHVSIEHGPRYITRYD